MLGVFLMVHVMQLSTCKWSSPILKSTRNFLGENPFVALQGLQKAKRYFCKHFQPLTLQQQQPFKMFAPCTISSSVGCITLGQTALKNVIFETAVMHSPKRIYFLSTVAVFFWNAVLSSSDTFDTHWLTSCPMTFQLFIEEVLIPNTWLSFSSFAASSSLLSVELDNSTGDKFFCL